LQEAQNNNLIASQNQPQRITMKKNSNPAIGGRFKKLLLALPLVLLLVHDPSLGGFLVETNKTLNRGLTSIVTNGSPDTPCGVIYPNPSTSPYILPFKPGETYGIHQGNCDIYSHFEDSNQAFAYDIIMPIGDEIVAMREGTVVYVVEEHADHLGPGYMNVLLINHDDGTQALYAHITQNGALVDVGEQVEQGQVVALSGHSGSVSPVAHLHVSLRLQSDLSIGLPLTFSNASPTDTVWLVRGNFYTALPY
jgi:murein DD-endopeptidase MepM/ murein hydrolase activator NlpD